MKNLHIKTSPLTNRILTVISPVERGAGRAIVAALVLACAGCSVDQPDASKVPWKSFVADGNHITYVAPVTMDDGTRCVVVFGNGAGRGVSCDWSYALTPNAEFRSTVPRK